MKRAPSTFQAETSVDVIVIGAGLCGAASGRQLQQAGYRVLILDANDIAAGASGIGGGMANPMMARKGRPIWKARESLDALEAMGVDTGRAPGQPAALLRPARDQEQADSFREQAALNPDLGRFVELSEAASLMPYADPEYGVLCVLRGASLDLGQLAQQWVGEIDFRQVSHSWQSTEDETGVTISDGEQAYRAARVLLCMGRGMATHPLTASLKLHLIKGQIIRVRKPDGLPPVLPPISSSAYLVDAGDGSLWIGSTFERNWTDEGPTDAATQSLLERAATLIPRLGQAEVLERRAGFRVTVPGTRLPMVGPLRKDSRIHVLTGMGARGVLHSAWFATRIPAFFNDPEAIPTRCRVVHRGAES